MISSRDKKFTVPRAKLLASLRQSLSIHRQQYQDAIRDYKKALIANLTQALKQAKSVTMPKIEDIRAVKVEFDAPVSHEREILRAIEELEYMDVDTVEIDEQTFNSYVRNEWPWASSFLSNAVKYNLQASRS
jgi:transcription initiation factor IIE alpha subunit